MTAAMIEDPVPAADTCRRVEPATSFVGSTVENDGSVTIMLRGRCDTQTTDRVAEHVELALARGARFLTVEIVGPLDAGAGLGDLLGRTQTRLADRAGLLVVRGLRPHALDG